MILLDANVLVYAVNADAPQHPASRAAVHAALAGRLPGVLVPQVLLEFLAIVTHPRRVSHPLDPARAWAQVAVLRAHLPVLDLRPVALNELGALLTGHPATGQDVFDLFLVAQMRSHGVTTICTYNDADFARLPVEALAPEEALARHGLA